MTFAHAVLGACLAWIAAYATALAAGAPLAGPFGKEAHVIVLAVAGATVVVQAQRRRRERLAWTLIGAGVLAWTAGEAYFTAALWDLEDVPVPSPADAGFVAAPVLLAAGVCALARARSLGAPRTLLLDGVTAGLAVAALSAATVLDRVLATADGHLLAVATNLAYPVADLALLTMCVAVVALRGWRLDRTWACIALGAVVFWGADSAYLLATAAGTFASGGWTDVGWWLGLLALCAASTTEGSPEPHDASLTPRRWEILLPVAFAGMAVAVFAYGCLREEALNPVAVALASGCFAGVLLRLVRTFQANVDTLVASREEALTDALTGLANRRALTTDLSRRLEPAHGDRQAVLGLFDLDGFKVYNDTFGHQAGDALLERLGQQLKRYVAGRGIAYRMGGDEFCVLVELGSEAAVSLLRGAASTLADRGDGFAVTASWGSVTLPLEAATPEQALRTADQRMYAHKHGRRPSAGRQSTDVLVKALAERLPDLPEHAVEVAALAGATAIELGLTDDAAEVVRQAAELHDIGKVAIPDAILAKPGPLDDEERAFIARHPTIGERIIAAAPSLTGVARLVRSSHERWDGTGYPDGLTGTDIPLGARIVAVCDAFDAMVADRPYAVRLVPAAAEAELRRCAGTQFDPVVVDAFVRARAAALATA